MNSPLLSWVGIGFLVGALAVFLFLDNRGASYSIGSHTTGQIPDGSAALVPETTRLGADFLGRGALSDRILHLDSVTRLDDPDLIVAEIQSRLDRPQSFGKRFEIVSLLTRLFEVDSSYAVRYVQSIELPDALLFSVFRSWAQIDASMSIALVGMFSEPSLETKFALAIIEIAGGSVIDNIVSESRTLNATALEVAALLRSAADDPLGALKGISELGSQGAQGLAISEVARQIAMVDPVSGLAEAQLLLTDRSQRSAFLRELYSQWALTDVSQFLDHLRTQDPYQQGLENLLSRALAFSAESDAKLVLDFGQEVGGPLGIAAEGAALEVLTNADPDTGVDYLDSIPNGYRRDTLISSIASGYARHDPDAALSWVRALRPPNADAEEAIIAVIASTDLMRALEIELEDPRTSVGGVIGAGRVPSWLASRMDTDLEDPVGMSNRILASDENGLWEEQRLSTVLSRWASTDIDGAISWMRDHRDDVPVAALDAVAEQLGASDVESHVALADMLSPDRRREWIGRVLTRAAPDNAIGAMSVANRYRTEPFYDSLVTSVIQVVAATSGPETAAQLLDASSPRIAVVLLSRRWARSDPARAASWALSLPNPEARAAAVTDVLTTWADRDFRKAIGEAQGLSDRALRESVVAAICQRNPDAADCL